MNENSYKKFSYVTLERIIGSILSAVFFLIFASFLDPTSYGEFGYFIALSYTFSVVGRFGLPQSVVVYLSKGEKILSNQINVLAVITTSGASIVLLFINETAAFLCISISFFLLFYHNLLGEKKYKSILKFSLLRSTLVFIVPFPLYFVFGIPGILIGMALGNIVVCAGFLRTINFREKSFQLLQSNFKVILNNFGIDASTTLVRSVDRLLIATIFGFAFTGIFIFNMQILFALEILPRALYSFLLSEESSGKKHTKINYLVILISVFIAISVIIISPIVVEQIFPNYSEGIPSLQILIISIIPISLSLIITAKMQAVKSTKVGYSAVIHIATLLILLSFLGSEFGLIGLSFAVLGSSIINASFLYFLHLKFSNS